MNQITDSILMIRPVNFRMNEETAVNNYFQEKINLDNALVNEQAQKEFDDFVQRLRAADISVTVVSDIKENNTPDSIFPNNWISFHQDGTVVLYPMFAENRRRERREDILDTLEQEGFLITQIIDYTAAEKEHIFLEGTGSLLLDRVHKKAYCALSPRANEDLLIEFCEDFEYTPVMFQAYQSVRRKRLPIYHTNVMMALAEKQAIICLDAIDNKKEKELVVSHLKEDGKELIVITEEQMHQFAGNMLQLKNKNEERFMIMSQAAYQSLQKEQISAIEKHSKIIYSDLHIIETCGGGSARCMMAEIFLPRQ
jgi:hypothetical protein